MTILGWWWLLCICKHLNFKGGFIFFIIETFSTFSSVTFYAQVCRWSILSLLPLIYDNTKRCSKMQSSMLHYMTNTGNFIIILNNAAYIKIRRCVIYISLFWYDLLRHYSSKNMISLFARRKNILLYSDQIFIYVTSSTYRILEAHTMKPNANKNEPLRFFNPLNHYFFMWKRNKYLMFCGEGCCCSPGMS